MMSILKNLKHTHKEEAPLSGPVLLTDRSRPFIEHLEELRKRICRSLLWIGVGTLCAMRYSHTIVHWLAAPVGQLVFTSPTEPILVHLKAGFLGGFFLAVPLLAWEVWGFLGPALIPREKRSLFLFVPLSAALFMIGAAFSWIILVPTAWKFLLSFGSDSFVPMVTIGNYVSFVSWLVIGCGLTFQMPLVLGFLVRLGIIRPWTLVRQWRVAVLVIFVAAAVITPTPDVVNQTLLALPMAALYLLSVGLAFLVRRDDPAGSKIVRINRKEVAG